MKRDPLRELKAHWGEYVLMTPFLLVFFTFTVIPVLITIGLSFTTYNVLEAPRFVGLDNYLRLFVNDEIFRKALKNTLIFAVCTGPLGYVLSFAAAWCINEMSRPVKAVLTFIFYMPTISGMVYTIWALVFSGDMYGYLNSALLSLGLINDPIQWLTTESYILPIIIIVQLWLSFGTGFLTMVAGFSTVGQEFYEAAAIDGLRNRMQELWYITIPMMAPHLMTSALLQITAMFASTSVSDTLVGFPSTNYAGHLIMSHLNDYANLRVERGYASAIAVFMFVFMILLNRFILGRLKKIGT